MGKPVILTLDDEPNVLGAIERDLRKHFKGDYRIVRATSGREALEALGKLKTRDDQVALFLVDQRMPGMSGTEFLEEAKKLYPDARKILLTAYADTQAAIDSINSVGLDYYLMKPWDPPEQTLYPVVDDLLADWQSTATQSYDGIRVAGALWSASSHDVKDFLARNGVPYRWLDVDADPGTKDLVERTCGGETRLPVLFFPDGDVLVEPDRGSIVEKIGMKTRAESPFYDLVVVGAGPAGLAAAVYGASEGLQTVMIEREATGGQAGTSSRIENYLGFPKGLSGADLARRATAQASRLGAEVLVPQEVTGIQIETPYKIVTLADDSKLRCYAIILASGVSVRRLQIPGIESVTGAGAYYGASLTEAAHYRGKEIYVVGGANSAGQGAMFFSRYAKRVTLVVRASSLNQSMSHYLIQQISGAPNIEVLTKTVTVEVMGESRLEGLLLENIEAGEKRNVKADALFVFIGAKPHTGFVSGLVQRDSEEYILTGQSLFHGGKVVQNDGITGWPLLREPLHLETSIPGIFAAGDVRSGSSKRVAAATGEGAVAVQLIHQYLKTV